MRLTGRPGRGRGVALKGVLEMPHAATRGRAARRKRRIIRTGRGRLQCGEMARGREPGGYLPRVASDRAEATARGTAERMQLRCTSPDAQLIAVPGCKLSVKGLFNGLEWVVAD